MQIVYLPQTRSDLRWMKEYYSSVFPEGARYARLRFLKAENLLRDNPNAGRPGALPGTRELVIAKTPFLILYRLQADRIEILRVWDARALRSPRAE
ncbi:type II toxin-antitoxin system RelE/ParE family toxin [Rhizobium panacihumi]|uniref:type II toxin-antitoxin system RelE/ParE family toxin n=1 Tax=Rhizobium panacihumi TaxID=2008450 RepID=UPI003D79856B